MTKKNQLLKLFPDAKCISYQVSFDGHQETFYTVIINEKRVGWGGSPQGAWSYAHFFFRDSL